MDRKPDQESYLRELRLLLEELCCDLCRFEHVARQGIAIESIRIDREFSLGIPQAYGDVRILPPNQPAYFVEVKYGYSSHTVIDSLRRKYGTVAAALGDASKVVLVIDCESRPDWKQTEEEIKRSLRPGLALEVWNETELLARIRERFGVEIGGINEADLLEVRSAIDRAKGFHAFGGTDLAHYEHDGLKSELSWHFGFWRLRQLREEQGLGPRQMLPPGLYREVAVVLADLCSFSSYVRDTRDDETIRHSLTSFYSKSRYQILNNGGMLYQFVGDEVVGLFGVPDHRPHYLGHALDTALSLLSIGNSVSDHWQRHLDRVQEAGGLHIGIAVGDLQLVSLRPFSRTHMGVCGDPINVAARLMTAAGPSEIVVSNLFYQQLSDEVKLTFQEIAPLEARNVGRVKGWKLAAKPTGQPAS